MEVNQIYKMNFLMLPIYILFLSHMNKEKVCILFSSCYYVHLIAVLSIL